MKPILPEPMTVSDENLWLLTGDDWAPFFIREVSQALTSIHLSIYMISDHWRAKEVGKINMVQTLCNAGLMGLNCRCIIDQPVVANRHTPFNTKAAIKLMDSGWKVRVMPVKHTLHEKILLIDQRLTIIGSHNISKASAISNLDTSLAVDSEVLAARVYRQFWERWRMADTFKV